MSPDEDIYAVEFAHLCSGCDSWSMRLIDARTQNLLNAQNCLPSELSKLLLWSGSRLVGHVQHNNQRYGLLEVQIQPTNQQINLLVEPSPPRANYHLLRTPAQNILNEKLPEKLHSPATQVLAFIKLNDHLFSSDPAHLIVLVGESQYDEYDYLAAAILLNLQKQLHPEYVFRTLFDRMGLGGRYSEDALSESISNLERILRQIHEPTALSDVLLSQQPDVFTYSALLHPALQPLAPTTEEGSLDIWNETFSVSKRLIAGDSVVSALGAVFQNADYGLSEFDADELAHFIESISQATAKASILSKTRTYKAILNPGFEAPSRFDTGLNSLQL
ncbi:MAG: hypothetical protein H5U29_12450 [Pusillimonas sp.]|nr:hypothetical protein [Pusillimonas sp.]